ncbi:hypothetical protein MMC21_005481 [Puttea exsequens]|nr:hypothetical protein [Puttea exsequens]
MDAGDRLKDCLTGKGPDVYVATNRPVDGPHRPTWSNWKTPEFQHTGDRRDRWDNLGYPFRTDLELKSTSKSARRREEKGEKYDFRTRKYARPHTEMWSDAKWDPNHPGEVWYHRDRYGHEVLHPPFDRWERMDRNPFELEGLGPRRQFIDRENIPDPPWRRFDR